MPATADEERVPTFAELGLPPVLVNALARQGIDAPFPIQAAAIPDVMAGRDVLGRGKTGSGKTLAFGLPLLTRLSGRKAAPKRPLALILVPTRELAQQVQTNLEPLGRGLGLRFKTVIGQTSMFKQIDALRRGVEVLVATPGRLKDLMRQGACDLSDIEIAVLDEADHMADMGFLPDVTDILDAAQPGGQRLLFSATLDKDVDVLVRRYLNDPVTHAIGPVDESVDTMDHHLLLVAPKEKAAVTAEIANREGRTILFARTKHGVDRLAKQLVQAGVRAAGLHGGKSQGLRTRTLAEFREGSISVLVATDVAARGIHVDDVSLVMHVDPPADHKDYMHRAGRTARAGRARHRRHPRPAAPGARHVRDDAPGRHQRAPHPGEHRRRRAGQADRRPDAVRHPDRGPDHPRAAARREGGRGRPGGRRGRPRAPSTAARVAAGAARATAGAASTAPTRPATGTAAAPAPAAAPTARAGAARTTATAATATAARPAPTDRLERTEQAPGFAPGALFTRAAPRGRGALSARPGRRRAGST
ncbi:DEAD/DEAH box helicase [Actinomadura madurae]|uniref:DEAD/DEAH box helicase n=1 Tax=Actinomadura madurae TaxID=1993 RepID=UPI0020D24AAA|nr:DEAD/DEAH box helicase [Actinomadura madurae]MCP9968900.1 DEAD/DEAH box helicase [Actinomadura madurae]